jgi:hypothetical protein
MKELRPFRWDLHRCLRELKALQRFLTESSAPAERGEVLPFFREHLHLSAFLGSYHQDSNLFDLLAHEYDLFGDFTCDIVVGDSATKVYGFVELEDAAPRSVFVKRTGKSSLEWAPRFEHGFSQVVDWFYKLDDMEKTDEFESRFGKPVIKYFGLLIVGKDESFGEKELRRLQWRQEKTLINSNRVICVTFNQLHTDLMRRASAMLQANRGGGPGGRKRSR